ncbi:uncharacterized protein LOC144164310 isoform X2 [Haemaphysalis longicornis]
MFKGCIMAVSADERLKSHKSCNQGTHANIPTVTIATQCALTLLVSSSSQTEEVPVVEVHGNPSGASSEGFLVLQDGADILVESGFHTCNCRPHYGNTGNFSDQNEKMQFEGNRHFCLPCQRNHQAIHVKVCTIHFRRSSTER